jgi:hypothetical protein
MRDEITRPTGSRLADVAATIAIGMALLEATARGRGCSAVDVESAKGRWGACWVITLVPFGRFSLAAFSARFVRQKLMPDRTGSSARRATRYSISHLTSRT